jgi:hypothetical protein
MRGFFSGSFKRFCEFPECAKKSESGEDAAKSQAALITMCEGTLPTGGLPPEKYSDNKAYNSQKSRRQGKDSNTTRTWQLLCLEPCSFSTFHSG